MILLSVIESEIINSNEQFPAPSMFAVHYRSHRAETSSQLKCL